VLCLLGDSWFEPKFRVLVMLLTKILHMMLGLAKMLRLAAEEILRTETNRERHRERETRGKGRGEQSKERNDVKTEQRIAEGGRGGGGLPDGWVLLEDVL
jgi:hypothetical protein